MLTKPETIRKILFQLVVWACGVVVFIGLSIAVWSMPYPELGVQIAFQGLLSLFGVAWTWETLYDNLKEPDQDAN